MNKEMRWSMDKWQNLKRFFGDVMQEEDAERIQSPTVPIEAAVLPWRRMYVRDLEPRMY